MPTRQKDRPFLFKPFLAFSAARVQNLEEFHKYRATVPFLAANSNRHKCRLLTPSIVPKGTRGHSVRESHWFDTIHVHQRANGEYCQCRFRRKSKRMSRLAQASRSAEPRCFALGVPHGKRYTAKKRCAKTISRELGKSNAKRHDQ